ncbi:spindle assembly checkpoint component Mad1 [Fimicolochytrium jonesii]|uniref:spindle assembly checkpoint component Mad1 n=1 Tax=Fimicolochytrium jonesii TaxID=1396493 RepID=UPI0022FE5FAA|nr:spindle assembly checkpoint component Mad1 [Fimicolochytrium jonesii]KAI8818311.1 spindle assembly checkpoint component Mad1 [Fimicolochytrium jonesii]
MPANRQSHFHPYQRSSGSLTSGLASPDRSHGTNRLLSLSQSAGPGGSEDIYGEFNQFVTRRELLRSTNGKSKSQNMLLRSTGTDDSFRRSAASDGNASLDLYTDPELIKARKEIRDLRDARRKLMEEKATFERTIHTLEKNGEEKESRLQEAMLRIDQLEHDREFLTSTNKNLLARLGTQEEDAIELRKKADMSSSALRREVSELRDQLAISRREGASRTQKLLMDNESLEHMLQSTQEQLHECHAERERQSEFIKAGREQFALADARYAEAKATIAHLQANGSASDELPVVRRQLTEQTSQVRSLEAKLHEAAQQIRYLRGMQENNERLKDEKQHLETQITRLMQYQAKVNTLELEIKRYQDEKAQWTAYLSERDDVGIDSPYALAKTLAQVRLELAELKERSGTDDAHHMGHKSHIQRLEVELQEAKEAAAAAERKRLSESQALKRLELSRNLAQKEIGYLREQLKSYDVEEEHLVSETYDRAKAQRIAKSDEMLDEYRKHVALLEKQLATGGATVLSESRSFPPTSTPFPPTTASSNTPDPQLLEKIRELESIVSQLRQEKLALHKESTALDLKVGQLEQSLGRGEYNTQTTRILQLAHNPELAEAAIRQSTLDALKQENQKLVQEVTRLGSSSSTSNSNMLGTLGGEGGANVPIESLRSVQLECTKLQLAVDEKEKRVVRLKEQFQLKAREYREAVYSLLGYKLEIDPDGRVRLTSTYADAHVPGFLFTSGDGDQGTLQLIDPPSLSVDDQSNPETAELEREEVRRRLAAGMAYYLQERNSVPAFLAGVTLELVERRGVVGG